MDIDLLFTAEGEAGLICKENPVQKAAGLVFDKESGVLTLEFVDMDYLDLNIPVGDEFREALDYCAQIHIGAIKNGHIAQAYQIPFMFLDDPYRAEALAGAHPPESPLMAFDLFVKRCVTGQPVNRDDLGNEDTMGCVLGEASPQSLEFAPHLARRHAMEVAPKLAPGMNVPGLGLGSSGGGRVQRTTQSRGSKKDDKS